MALYGSYLVERLEEQQRGMARLGDKRCILQIEYSSLIIRLSATGIYLNEAA